MLSILCFIAYLLCLGYLCRASSGSTHVTNFFVFVLIVFLPWQPVPSIEFWVRLVQYAYLVLVYAKYDALNNDMFWLVRWSAKIPLVLSPHQSSNLSEMPLNTSVLHLRAELDPTYLPSSFQWRKTFHLIQCKWDISVGFGKHVQI